MKNDSQLQQDVSAELTWEPSVHAARIRVEVTDGVVTLAGQVDSYSEKWNAEHAAQRVAGVKAMTTELKVHFTGLSKRTDADARRAQRGRHDAAGLLRPADAQCLDRTPRPGP